MRVNLAVAAQSAHTPTSLATACNTQGRIGLDNQRQSGAAW